MEKIIIKNNSDSVDLDSVFQQLPLARLLNDGKKYPVVVYVLPGDDENHNHDGKEIVVVRTILKSGTYRIEINLDDEVIESNALQYEDTEIEKLN